LLHSRESTYPVTPVFNMKVLLVCADALSAKPHTRQTVIRKAVRDFIRLFLLSP
jgi:hypothetical protein